MSEPFVLSLPLLDAMRERCGAEEAIILLQRKVGHSGTIRFREHKHIEGMFVAVANGLSVYGYESPTNNCGRSEVWAWGMGTSRAATMDNLYEKFREPMRYFTEAMGGCGKLAVVRLVSDDDDPCCSGTQIVLREDIQQDGHMHPYFTQVGAQPIP